MIDILLYCMYKSIIFLFRISFGMCGRFTAAELVSFALSVTIVCIWVLTGHWLLMDGDDFFFMIHNSFIFDLTLVS